MADDSTPLATTHKPTSLSFFTGAGGLDLGIEAAGFQVKLCIENDTAARATLTQSTAWKLSEEPGDILCLDDNDLVQQSGLRPGMVDLICAGPPCQPFSKSSYWAHEPLRMKDPRARTMIKLMSFVEFYRPKALLIENVRAIGFAEKDDGRSEIAAKLAGINANCGTKYCLQELILDAASFGVPQHRERAFLFASIDGRLLSLPHTHEPAASTSSGLLPTPTAWDAIGDLADLEDNEDLRMTGKWADLLPSVPEGANYLYHTPGAPGEPLFGYRTRFWSFLLKLAKNRPSWTIQASPGPATGPFHWSNRRLSTRELARLQSFPDTHRFSGDFRTAQKQIGNAVPPTLSFTLGSAIRSQILDLPALDIPNPFLLTASNEYPAAELTRPVVGKFLDLRGEHKPHPGHGLGPGAKRRKERVERMLRQSG